MEAQLLLNHISLIFDVCPQDPGRWGFESG
jgi:hypothetical protein